VYIGRLVAQARQVDRRLGEAEARFDALVSAEVEARAAELERTLSRARADSLSKLVAEERKIGETRRAALAGASMPPARAERALARSSSSRTPGRGLNADLERTGAASPRSSPRSRSSRQPDGPGRVALSSTPAPRRRQRGAARRLTELETQFARAADELSQSSQEQLEVQERERRRALH
jgi:hypothetical protein